MGPPEMLREYHVMGKRMRHRWLERVIEEAERMSRQPSRQVRLRTEEGSRTTAEKERRAARHARLSA